ncbi:hypothetical protein V8F33_011288 [Rhypophila sp. PSN 637]
MQLVLTGARNDEGLWTQNCTGLVAVQYKTSLGSAAQGKAFIDEGRKKVESHKEFYARLKEDNLPQLGPVFQVLKTIGSGNYESICDLVISDTAAMMPENYEHDRVVHPTTLDGAVQMAALAATEGGLTVDRAKIPKFIDGVWVSAKMFDKKAGAKLVGYSTSKPFGKAEYVDLGGGARHDPRVQNRCAREESGGGWAGGEWRGSSQARG